jgi:Flp pilus assembly protein TadG
MDNRYGRSHAQALVEFAIALPILILLVAGVLELGRGYSYAIAVSDAARDGARYVAGKTATTNGPGIAAMCNLIKADLAAVTTNVSCASQSPVVPPRPGVDYTVPVGGQAVVAVYCGASVDCIGRTNLQIRSEVDVYVYYGFNDLNILGGLVTLTGSSKTTTSW